MSLRSSEACCIVKIEPLRLRQRRCTAHRPHLHRIGAACGTHTHLITSRLRIIRCCCWICCLRMCSNGVCEPYLKKISAPASIGHVAIIDSARASARARTAPVGVGREGGRLPWAAGGGGGGGGGGRRGREGGREGGEATKFAPRGLQNTMWELYIDIANAGRSPSTRRHAPVADRRRHYTTSRRRRLHVRTDLRRRSPCRRCCSRPSWGGGGRARSGGGGSGVRGGEGAGTWGCEEKSVWRVGRRSTRYVRGVGGVEPTPRRRAGRCTS